MRKVLVLGSNSFSGSHYVNLLLKSGYSVLAVSRSIEPNTVFLPYRWCNDDNFKFYQLDINSDLNDIMELVHSEKPSYIVNFAALGMVAESWKAPGDWFRTNALSQILLHDQLRKCSFIQKFVHVSTPEVYGATSIRMKESTVYSPTTPYAVSRAAADMSLISFFSSYKFPVVFTRAANVYGPGQQLYRLIPRTAIAGLTKAKMRLSNGGKSQRSFIHIRDVVQATLTIMERGVPGEVYHIATNRLSSIRETAEITARTIGVDLTSIAEDGPGRLSRDSIYDLDSSKIRCELGWNDSISLEEGIAETVDWVRKNLDVLRLMPFEYIHRT